MRLIDADAYAFPGDLADEPTVDPVFVVRLDMAYYYKGSSNTTLTLVEKSDGIDLVTDYGETITTVQSGYGLMRILEDLHEDKYA